MSRGVLEANTPAFWAQFPWGYPVHWRAALCQGQRAGSEQTDLPLRRTAMLFRCRFSFPNSISISKQQCQVNAKVFESGEPYCPAPPSIALCLENWARRDTVFWQSGSLVFSFWHKNLQTKSRTFQQVLKLFRQSICVWASARKLDAIGCDVLRTDLNGDITKIIFKIYTNALKTLEDKNRFRKMMEK